jgi:hypothetical protein
VSTFAQLAAHPSTGLGILVDVSTDKFATILSVSGVSQRWATATGRYNNPSNTFYLGNIASVGRHQRALGADGLVAAATISLVLDNTDGALDWLTARSTVESTVLKCRFRVYVVAFDPTNPTDNAVQPLGTFQPLDMPTRDESRVYLELADDVLGEAADLTLSPSPKSWLDSASTTSGNTPWASGPGALAAGVSWVADPERPLPLAFGNVRVPLIRLVSGDLQFHPHVVCCTTNTGLLPTAPDSKLISFSAAERSIFGGLSLPGFWDRSPFTITRDGRDWRIWLVQFDVNAMLASPWVMSTVLEGAFGAPGTATASINRKDFTDAFFAKAGQLYVTAYPLSSHTYPPGGAAAGFSVAATTCVNVARDLLAQYCRTGVIIDVPSFDAVSAASPGSVSAAYVGDIGQRGVREREATVVGEAGQIRGVLQGLAQSGNFDLTTFANGQVRAITNTASSAQYLAAAGNTLFRFEETRVVADSLKVRIPSQGQRWAPYNRIFLELGAGSGDLAPGRNGPFDHAANIAAWGRPFTRIIDVSYADVSQGGIGNAFNVSSGVGFNSLIESQFNVESKIRPVVSFRYGIEALQLELGDFFMMSITRGGNTGLLDTYVDAIWKVEALNFLFETGQVEVEGVWSGDLLTEIPFLLDDETLITRYTSASASSGEADDLSFNLLGAGSFTTAGVVAGDILVLQDATEAADEFARNRGIRIETVVSATQLSLIESVSGGPFTIATWKILRGATTYRADGRQFGKSSSGKSAGVFSDSTAANRITSG